MPDDLTSLWRAVLASAPSLERHIETLVEEELSPSLLTSMHDVQAALSELGLDEADRTAIRQRVHCEVPRATQAWAAGLRRVHPGRGPEGAAHTVSAQAEPARPENTRTAGVTYQL